jgi:hypothetical protein
METPSATRTALQRRRRRIGVRVPGEQLLGRVQIAPAQDEAAVALLRIPLDGPDQQACVCPEPREIRLDRLDERLEGGVAIVAVAGEDPVHLGECLGRGMGIGLTADDRHDPLSVRLRILKLVRAFLGADRIWADDEDDVVRRVDPGGDVRAPGRARRDVLRVDPDVLAALGEERVQLRREAGVTPGVREEDVCACSPSGLRRGGAGSRHRIGFDGHEVDGGLVISTSVLPVRELVKLRA